MKSRRLAFGAILFAFLGVVLCFEVSIDYSFPLPTEWGVAIPSDETCCPYLSLPENKTDALVVPTVIGLGAQKAGTTTLYARLLPHPQLYHGQGKELHVLNKAVDISLPDYLRRWRWNRPENATDDTKIEPPERGHLYEITPSYLYTPIAACRLKIISPNAKLIVMFREPASRFHSAISFLKRQRLASHPDLEGWAVQDLWNLTYHSLQDIESNDQCDFHSGKGVRSYHDCCGCVADKPGAPAQCEQEEYVTIKANGEYECGSVATWAIFRGMYAAQLSSWFTFFPPSQFKLINSNDFFADPLRVLQDLGAFLDLQPTYSEDMMEHSAKKQNVGSYKEENEEIVEATMRALREYYRRPNLELYRLLRETGHDGFVPFEKELRYLESLDCHDAATVETGICGADLATWLDSDWQKLKIPDGAEMRAAVSRLKQQTIEAKNEELRKREKELEQREHELEQREQELETERLNIREAALGKRNVEVETVETEEAAQRPPNSKGTVLQSSAIDDPARVMDGSALSDSGHISEMDSLSHSPVHLHYIASVFFSLSSVYLVVFIVRRLRIRMR